MSDKEIGQTEREIKARDTEIWENRTTTKMIAFSIVYWFLAIAFVSYGASCGIAGMGSVLGLEICAYIVCLPIVFILSCLISMNGLSALVLNNNARTVRTPEPKEDEEESLSREDSEGDGLMSEGDIMFPAEDDDDNDD